MTWPQTEEGQDVADSTVTPVTVTPRWLDAELVGAVVKRITIWITQSLQVTSATTVDNYLIILNFAR